MIARISLALLFAVALGAATPLPAQEPSGLEFGQVTRLRSQALGEERRLNVFLPPGYAAGSDRYPVFYLLDGSAHEDYFHAASLIDFMATYGVMPPTIVVGISNVDRKRDFTMPSADEEDRKAVPTSGGAEKFVAFLATELIPFVDKTYRTTGRRILFGQSLGGLLASKVLLEKPALFTDYILVSPSLWWNREALLEAAPELLKKNAAPGRKVYLSVGEEHPQMVANARELAKLLGAAPWTGLEFRFDFLDHENHATAGHISLYRGLEFLFAKKDEPKKTP